MTERSNNFKSNRAINLKFKFFSIQFDYIVWIFNFFQFSLNVLFEFSIFFNSIWIFCLNFQFFSIQFECHVWIFNFSQLNLNILFEMSIFINSKVFFQINFFLFQSKSNKIDLDGIEDNLVHFKLFEKHKLCDNGRVNKTRVGCLDCPAL